MQVSLISDSKIFPVWLQYTLFYLFTTADDDHLQKLQCFTFYNWHQLSTAVLILILSCLCRLHLTFIHSNKHIQNIGVCPLITNANSKCHLVMIPSKLIVNATSPIMITSGHYEYKLVNTLRLWQNGRCFADDIFRCILTLLKMNSGITIILFIFVIKMIMYGICTIFTK